MDIQKEALELPFRISKCIVIATEHVDALTESCQELIQELPEEVIEAVSKVIPVHRDFTASTLDEGFIQWLQDKEYFGFLVEAQSPYPRFENVDDQLCEYHSWGRYVYHAAYGLTLDEAIANAAQEVKKYNSFKREMAQRSA
ncbi:hypothetical protein J7963_19065 [Vibrio parahaemolyticus]|nr:hypothetical protein [Vibrio parahaemolyticus]